MTNTVTIERTYLAPPERVFEAWVDVDQLTKWWGCAADMLWDVHSWDVTVGGEIHVGMDFDGETYEVRGRFLQIDRPHTLRYEWEGGQIITVSIVADGAGSKMTVEHAGLASDEMQDIVTGGWSASVEQILTVLS